MHVLNRVRFAQVFVLVAVFSIGAAALAQTVRGSLTIPEGYGQAPAVPGGTERAATRDYYWEEWNGFVAPAPPRFDAKQELAVVLVGAGPGPEGGEARIFGGNFERRTIALRAGTALSVVNADACAHTIYSESGGWSPLQTAPGRTRRGPNASVGTFVLRDKLYPQVEAYVHVLADLVAVADVAPDGKYVFSNAPTGSFTIKVLKGNDVIATSPIEITDGREVTVNPIALGGAPAAPAPSHP